ncbi:tetratricopeptide repeat protein [candidate division KSB1 bacterium]|nr:tetratricopeptide repeat protein [candidate division KSB1 bacterium]
MSGINKIFLMFTVIVFSTHVYAQQNIIQEEQDFQFALQLFDKGMYDLAAQQYMKFTENFPTSINAPQAFFNAALSFEKSDSLNRAAKTYLDLLLKYPQSSLTDQALFNRALILFKLQDYINSALTFERLKLFTPKSNLVPEAQLRAAQTYLELADFTRALDAVNFITENFSTHPLRFEAYLLLAEIQGRQGQLTPAFNELNKITGSQVQDNVALKANLLKSQLYAQSGRFHKSDSLLTVIVKSGFVNDIVGKAAVELAVSQQRQGMYAKSNELVANLVAKDLRGDFKNRLLMISGDNSYLAGDFDAALRRYNQCSKPELPLNYQCALEFRKGFMNRKSGKNKQAIVHFSAIVADTACPNPVIKHKSLQHYAYLLCEEGESLEAVHVLQENLYNDQTGLFKDETLFALGSIQEKYLHDPAGARNSYASISTISPKSRLVDDAQLNIARSWEVENNIPQAIMGYQRYLNLFPGADNYENVENRLNILKKIVPASPEQIQKSFNELFIPNFSNISGPQKLLEWIKTEINIFHNYERALSLIKQAFLADTNEQLNKDELYYLRARCHSALAEKYFLENQPLKTASHIDTLNQTVSQLQSNYASSKWTHWAKFQAVNTSLINITNPGEKIQILETALLDFPRESEYDSMRNVLNVRLVREIVAGNADSTNWLKLQKAGLVCSEILSKPAGDVIYARALQLDAQILHRLGETDSAVVLLTKSIKLNHNATILDSKILLADIYLEKGENDKALAVYENISSNYYYSNRAIAIKTKHINILIGQGKHEKAESILKKEIPPIPEELKPLYLDQENDEELLWLSAQLKSQNAANPLNAMQAYRDYIYTSKLKKYQPQALLAMGELAMQLNNRDVAVGHFEELIKNYPADTLAQIARVKSADIYYDQGLYQEARVKYNGIKSELTGDLAVHANAREVLCDYKLGNLSRAKTMADDFSKRFDAQNFEALFLYEEGMYFIKQKDFEQAEKSFKNLIKKYDEIPEGAQGELGLARMYVITGKPDDALKILTKIPEKYKDPDILASAYLNLADFYYENRLLSQCISACENVLKYQKPGILHAQAMNMLIKSYDEFRLKDKAIAQIREYIDLYPDNSDILEKKVKIGVLLYELKDYERAINQLKQVKPLVSADEEPEVQYWIAKCYADKGETAQAIIEFLKVKLLSKPTKLPWGVTALYEAGLSYRKLGNFDKAIELLQQVVRERGATDNIGRAANARIIEIQQEMENKSFDG